MAILFNGIVMSHYTHFNLSTVTQITMQQTMRTLAFIAETCVFAYLGLALFSFRHRVSYRQLYPYCNKNKAFLQLQKSYESSKNILNT